MEQKKEAIRPKVSHEAQKELDRVEKSLNQYQDDVKSIDNEVNRNVAIREEEPQTKLSSKEIAKKNDIYLKPERHIPDNQKFNEKFREEWNFQKEFVNFIAEHREIIGDVIEMWTHPFGGVGAQFWKVPTNKPVWGPRYLAEQIKSRRYVKYVTPDRGGMSHGSMQPGGYDCIKAEVQVQRLDANPVIEKRSVFMGSSGF